MRAGLADRTTVSVNVWSVFTDVVIAMLLLVVFLVFVQFVANSRALVRLLVEERQRMMAERIEVALDQDRPFLTVVLDGNLQRLRFSDAILFDAGSDVLKSVGERVLGKVGVALMESPGFFEDILIEGHTDTVPIATTRFPSNWELSSARATAVVRYLEDEVGIDPSAFRISAVGKSEYVPVDGDLSQRARNRRIEIVLVYSERGLVGS